MTKHARYGHCDVEVVFTAETERCDYGVLGSPVWDEVNPSTVEVIGLNILGVDVNIKELPSDLQDAIYALWAEVEWE